ncbi:CvpA family protein [Lachnospiraceae bacterium]|nr:CvpA family protein [Lachnospiraceae bacterium]
MDILFVIVLAVLAGFGLHGYLRGMVRVLFSLAAIFLTVGLATALTPVTAEFLKERTPLYHTIQEKCTDYIQEFAVHKEESSDVLSGETEILGQKLPRELQDILQDGVTDATGELLENTGIYERLGEFAAEQILQRAAWILSFSIIFVAMVILVRVLDLVAKLPVLNSINHIGGLAIGLVQGVIVIWILFLLVALCQGSDWGREMLETIQGNDFLRLFYDNNIIEQFLMGIFK